MTNLKSIATKALLVAAPIAFLTIETATRANGGEETARAGAGLVGPPPSRTRAQES